MSEHSGRVRATAAVVKEISTPSRITLLAAIEMLMLVKGRRAMIIRKLALKLIPGMFSNDLIVK